LVLLLLQWLHLLMLWPLLLLLLLLLILGRFRAGSTIGFYL